MSSRELQLIVNADDFGQSEDTFDATVECFEAGALTSATVMPGMPATERALEFGRAHPEFGFGVHLTLCADPLSRPLCDPALVPSLVRADGTLLSTREVRMKAVLGRLVPQELEREIEAQVRVVVEAGIPVTHVDSHRHLHKFEPVRRALESVLPRLGIRRARAVQDIYLSRPWRSPTYWLGRCWRNSLRRPFETTEHFFMPSMEERPWAQPLATLIEGMEANSFEIGVHPGRSEEWRDRDRAAALELAGSFRRPVTLVNWRTLSAGATR
jgi:predicted glycoside hydrolase/deacetylase ChbG (UPF0249 family)